MIYLNIVFVLIYLYLFNRIFNLRNFYNPLVFSVVYHFIFFYCGLFYRKIYSHIEITDFTVFLINYSFLLIFVGGLISRAIIQKQGTSYLRFPKMEFSPKTNKEMYYTAIIIIVIGLTLAVALNISNGGIVFLMDEIENNRIQLRQGKGLITQLMIVFLTFGTLVIFVFKHNNNFLTFLIIITTTLLLLSIGNRGPALFYVLYFFFVFQFIKQKQFSWKKLILIFLILFMLMVLLGSLRVNHEADLIDLIKFRFGWRPFVNIQNFQLVLDYFPSQHDFLYGQTYLVDFSILLPGSNPNSGTFLKQLMELDFDGGSITPSYLGISYVNFGYLGLFLSPLIFGFLANFFYEVYVNNVKINNPQKIVLILFVSNNFAAVIVSGIMTVLIQNMILILFTYVIIIILNTFIRKVDLIYKLIE